MSTTIGVLADAGRGQVRIRFSAGTIALTPDSARRLAAKLLLLAEAADERTTVEAEPCRGRCGAMVDLPGYCDHCLEGY